MRKKSLLLFVCVLVLGPAWSAFAGLDPSLVGLWPLDDGAGTVAVDGTGNGNDGIINGDPPWVPGMINGALEFDGDGDYVDCGDSPLFIIPVNITVACWIKVNAFTTDWQAIVTTGDGSWRVHRSGGTNNVAWGTQGLEPLDLTGTTDVSTGDWFHIAATSTAPWTLRRTLPATYSTAPTTSISVKITNRQDATLTASSTMFRSTIARYLKQKSTRSCRVWRTRR